MQEQDSTVHLAATCPVCGSTGYEANSPCPLHAAAPALLAALEGIALGGCCQSPGCSPDDPKCDAMAARAAIAQAKVAA